MPPSSPSQLPPPFLPPSQPALPPEPRATSSGYIETEEDDDEMGDVENQGHLHHPLLGGSKLGKLEFPLLDAVEKPNFTDQTTKTSCLRWVLMLLEMPLCLPRRLTIPVVCEERWSKPYAVIAATLAPVLLAALWISVKDMGSKASLVVSAVGGLVGLIMGFLAIATTNKRSPPKRCLVLWLAGGFVMSVVWTYIIAQEFVALMIPLGDVLGIRSSILGLTILTWGNSLGDLIANLTMALNGGREGAQIAIAGCYARAIFNKLVGLGLSLFFSAWRDYPSSVPMYPNVSREAQEGAQAGWAGGRAAAAETEKMVSWDAVRARLAADTHGIFVKCPLQKLQFR